MEQETDVRSRPRAAEGSRPAMERRRVLHRQAHDRWAWRRAVRRDPRKYHVYRIVVAVIGTLLMLLGVATGWLPGPGGIPLVLLGLAVLATEFEWAHRLLQRARVKAHEFTRWAAGLPPWIRALGMVGTAAALVAAGWLALVVFGLPAWMPGQATAVLDVLPGVR